jgi:hypothetical protein
MPRSRPVRGRHAVLILLVCGAIAGGLAIAFGGSSNYDGPTCTPGSAQCRETSNGGPWVPYWYYGALAGVQSGGRGSAGYVPSVYGRQPTASEEEADGATDEEAEGQQASQQDYVNSAGDESAEGSEDQADGDDPSGGGSRWR